MTFLQSGGIYERTIEDLYGCEIFFLGRPSIHETFFLIFMADDVSCLKLQNLLFDLMVAYGESYNKHVCKTAGDIEKRMKSGKAMVVMFESDRNETRESFRKNFVSLSKVKELFDEPELEGRSRNVSEQSNFLFCYLENFAYKNFWKHNHFSRGLGVDSFITERSSDSTYNYSVTMLHKLFDITGYLCGHRVYNLIHLHD